MNTLRLNPLSYGFHDWATVVTHWATAVTDWTTAVTSWANDRHPLSYGRHQTELRPSPGNAGVNISVPLGSPQAHCRVLDCITSKVWMWIMWNIPCLGVEGIGGVEVIKHHLAGSDRVKCWRGGGGGGEGGEVLEGIEVGDTWREVTPPPHHNYL